MSAGHIGVADYVVTLRVSPAKCSIHTAWNTAVVSPETIMISSCSARGRKLARRGWSR